MKKNKKEKATQEYERVRGILFDEKNTMPIRLKNGDDKEVDFFHVYSTLIGDDIYCILSPLVELTGVKCCIGMVFRLTSTGDIVYEQDTKISSAVFNSYYDEISRKGEG